MIYLGSLMARRAYSDSILLDVATIGHQRAVSDMVGSKVFDRPAHHALVTVAFEYDITEVSSDLFLTLGHWWRIAHGCC